MTARVRGGGVDGTAAGDPAALPSTYVETLMVVLSLARPTISGIVAVRGLSRSVVHRHLVRLRECGLVEWEDRKHATLRPTVEVVA